MKLYTALAAASSLLATVSAHGGVGTYTIGSTVYQGWSPYNSASGQKSIQRQYSTFDPLLTADLSKAVIRCNNPGVTGTGLSATVAAGATIKTHWVQWTHRPASVMVYMAKCPAGGCNSWDGAGKAWFKIAQTGLVSGTQNSGKWAGDTILDTLDWTITVPKDLVAGEYLIRHELLAVHQANNPQFYPECAQLIVTGSGTSSPPASFLVSFPGAYSASEPGIAFNIDSEAAKVATTYPIPGPAVWDGSSSGPTNPDPVPTTTTLSTAVTPPATSATPVPSSTPVTPPCEVAKYAQCGGKNYSGCKVCASGSTCKANGDFYSQCL
ncbi:carbohydrate-binding module family 1 protein [Amniculicola lignicola CBS 123094]|uniref:AA9 family lytic polysaccharide monooxygenase n=1 Tax=Amniculicola lignicola CBS 123094 TaxID=1392246 RepID=A0A6A5WMJ5_9PLEO|nr:carbohydrate-binding module family 1 protein [Amniculicola lignicola CBS 123094]